jgi:hypothetical protein
LKASLKITCFRPALAGLLAAVVAVTCGSATALAKTSGAPSLCPSANFSQPFADLGDSDWYTLVDGQTHDNFDGTGWTLSDGASVVPNDGPGGNSGSVLDLPSGSTAVSPPVCVTADYPHMRTMVRDVEGSEGVKVFVSYAGTKTEDDPKKVGRVDGEGNDWTLSRPVKLKPDKEPGLQTMTLTLEARGRSSRFQVYNLYMDPRMK